MKSLRLSACFGALYAFYFYAGNKLKIYCSVVLRTSYGGAGDELYSDQALHRLEGDSE